MNHFVMLYLTNVLMEREEETLLISSIPLIWQYPLTNYHGSDIIKIVENLLGGGTSFL